MKHKLAGVVLLAQLAVAWLRPGAWAQTDWYAATNGSGSAGTAWDTAFTNIQDALDAASPGDTVYVAGQVFRLSNQIEWTTSDLTLRGGYAATNAADQPGPSDPEQWPTVLTPTGGTMRVLFVDGITDSVLGDVTLTGGNENHGAGVMVNASSNVVLSGCTIESNAWSRTITGDSFGLGVHVASSFVTLTHCVVRNNSGDNTKTAYAGWYDVQGGGLYLDSGSTVLVRDSRVQDNECFGNINSATFGRGGGIYVDGGNLQLKNVLLAGNVVDNDGPGLYVGSGTVRLDNCTIADNAGTGIMRVGGSVTVSNSIIQGNWPDIDGTVTIAYSDIGDTDYGGNNITADPRFEYGYYLAEGSPCTNAGSDTAANLGLDAYTTRKDGVGDTDAADMGYHYQGGFDLTYADLYVSPSGGDGNAGTSWAQAFRTVGKALTTARDGTRVHVAMGQYTNGLETFPLTVVEKPGVQILGTNAAGTVLDADGSGTRVLGLTRSHRAVLENITLTHGETYEGAGLQVDGSQGVLLSGCQIVSNAFSVAVGASRNGAGIYAASSDVTLSNCVVRGNTGLNTVNHGSSGVRGGGIWCDGSLTVHDSLIRNNASIVSGSYTVYGQGGGIYFTGANLTLRNVLLTVNNVSGSGGGLYVNSGTAELLNCSVVDQPGEGIRQAGGALDVTDCIVWGNGIDITGTATVAYSDVADTDHGGNNISADPAFESGYYLGDGSPCIDTGSDTAANLGLDGRTTRTDGTPDADTVDMGYHYRSGFDLTYANLYASPSGDDSNGGTNWVEAFRTVTKALATAQAGSRIHVAMGLYTNGLETFPLTVTDMAGVEIVGTNAVGTVFDADGSGTRVAALTRAHRTVLRDVTLTHGETYEGGGVQIEDSQDVLLSGCVIENNTFSTAAGAQRNGAGLYAAGSAVTLTNCIVRGNTALNIVNHGSAGAYGGGVCSDGTLTLCDSEVVNNLASVDGSVPYGRGGGLYFDGNVLDCRNVLFAENSTMRVAPDRKYANAAGAGHGLYVAGGAVSLVNCSVVDHPGEGIRQTGGTVTATNSIFWGNWSNVAGTVTMSHCDVGGKDYGGTNISADPRFEYGYYLGSGSPCVNAGSDSAANLGMDAYTTQTDGSGDEGVVDMGYHYTNSFDLTYANLYVSPSGDDGNGGTSWAEAFRSVSKALEAAREGTRIHVAAGEYAGGSETFPLAATDKPGIQVLGTNAARTVLDANGSGMRVMCLARCHRAVVKDLTLKRGGTSEGGGLGIKNSQGVLVSGCVVVSNTYSVSAIFPRNGAGIHAASSDVTLTNCVLRGNTGANPANHSQAYTRGGGIWSDGPLTVCEAVFVANAVSSQNTSRGQGGGVAVGQPGRAMLRNVLIAGSDAGTSGLGDGLYVNAAVALLDHCTVVDNDGQGVNNAGGTASVTNSIIWGNGDDVVGTVPLGWSNIEDGDNDGVDGCISTDPLFVDTVYYHLQSRGGNYSGGYFNGGTWGNSPSNSPSIDVGNPLSDFSREPNPNGSQVNMGAYGNTAVASRTMAPGTLFLIR